MLSAKRVPLAHGVVSARRDELDREDGQEFLAETDVDGGFHIPDLAAGPYLVTLRAPGHTAQRLRVEVPQSFSITLPPIELSAECYARARFVSAAGAPVQVSRVIGRSFDVRGTPLTPTRDEWTPSAADKNGAVLIGPLPRGITMLAVDLPGFARTRLPDVRVSGVDPIVEVGAVVVARGADLRVHVVDARGAPRGRVRVSVVDTAALSPIGLMPAETDAQGLATFERLGRGTYRLTAHGDFPCGKTRPEVERLVDLPAEGQRHERLVVGGASVTVEAVRQDAPLPGVPIVLEPVRTMPRWPAWWPFPSRPGPDVPPYIDWSLCEGSTDGGGRLTLSNVPFGLARVTVQLPSATWSTVVSVPVGGRSLRLDIPGEAVSLHVTRGDTGEPVPDADVGWDGAHGTVRSRGTVTGDVLLDGISQGPGRLTVAAEGFYLFERDLQSRPDVTVEVGLTPKPPPYALVRVSDLDDGSPIADAVVYFDLEDQAADDSVATAGPEGTARFDVRRPSTVRVMAWASGYAGSSTTAVIREDSDATIAVALRRGPQQ